MGNSRPKQLGPASLGGCLRNGNPSGDHATAPRCGAKTRRGSPCQAPAMRSVKTGDYTRCRMHGEASTGPKTEEGLERCRQARWKHGQRSAAAIAERKQGQAAKGQIWRDLRGLEILLRLWWAPVIRPVPLI